MTLTITKIKSIADVKAFFTELKGENLAFHPDNAFEDYVTPKWEPTYTPQEAEVRTELLEQCFKVCNKKGADIYDIGMQIFYPELR